MTGVQVYMPKEVSDAKGGKELTKTGASLLVRGEIAETPPEVTQPVELRATEVLHYGSCDSKTYPMAKKRHGMEFLREKAHLRPRTNVIGAVARIRSQLAYATHTFFQQHGFQYVHTPIITASDCEGAGEMFQVCILCPIATCTLSSPLLLRSDLQFTLLHRSAAYETAAGAVVQDMHWQATFMAQAMFWHRAGHYVVTGHGEARRSGGRKHNT